MKPVKMLRSPIAEGRTSTDIANKIYRMFKTTSTSEKSLNTCFGRLLSFKMMLLIKYVIPKYIENTTAKMMKNTMNVITSGINGVGPGGEGLSNAVINRITRINDNVDKSRITAVKAVGILYGFPIDFPGDKTALLKKEIISSKKSLFPSSMLPPGRWCPHCSHCSFPSNISALQFGHFIKFSWLILNSAIKLILYIKFPCCHHTGSEERDHYNQV